MTTSRERMAVAMRGEPPDRVPVMCQLALGHYFLHAGIDPVDIWHDGPAFAAALVRLQERYGFDGILVNLPGREPCSVALATPPENIAQLRAAADEAARD